MSNAITLSSALAKRLEKFSAASGRRAQTIAQSAIAEKLDYEEWALKKIDRGLADIKAGKVYSTEVLLKKLHKARAARAGKPQKAA